MSTPTKKKLCWNCEGNVSRQADNCPYCGVYLHREQDEDDFEDDVEEELSPPYQPIQTPHDNHEVPLAPYSAQPTAPAKEAYIQQAASPWLKLSGDWKQAIFPVLFLLGGSILLLFGLLLLLFAHDGVLTLSWNANAWFVYLGAAVPLLYFGWRSLQKMTDAS